MKKGGADTNVVFDLVNGRRVCTGSAKGEGNRLQSARRTERKNAFRKKGERGEPNEHRLTKRSPFQKRIVELLTSVMWANKCPVCTEESKNKEGYNESAPREKNITQHGEPRASSFVQGGRKKPRPQAPTRRRERKQKRKGRKKRENKGKRGEGSVDAQACTFNGAHKRDETSGHLSDAAGGGLRENKGTMASDKQRTENSRKVQQEGGGQWTRVEGRREKRVYLSLPVENGREKDWKRILGRV